MNNISYNWYLFWNLISVSGFFQETYNFLWSLSKSYPVTIEHDFCFLFHVINVWIQVEFLTTHSEQKRLDLLIYWLLQTNCNLCHQCEVLYNTNFLTFWRFRRTNHTEMSIVQQSGLCRFGTWLDWSYNSSQMRQCCKESGISFKHLCNTRSNDFSSHWFTPVTCGKGSPQSSSDWPGVKNKLNLFLDFRLLIMELSPDDFFSILDVTVLKLIFKQTDHQCTCHIESLLTIMISIVFVDFPQKPIQQLLNHVPNEERFLSKATLVHSDVRENLIHQDPDSILSSCWIISLFELLYMSSNKCQTFLRIDTGGCVLNTVPDDFKESFHLLFVFILHLFIFISLAQVNDTINDLKITSNT